MQRVLVTGAAGFIGFHVARRLLADGGGVVGLDNLNPYYDPALKKARLAELAAYPEFHFQQCDVADRAAIADIFAARDFEVVIHLAAQAGVRHSLREPYAYADTNIVGFLNILEGCRHGKCKHLIYASSSSVYGANTRKPSRTSYNTDHPLSLYGATKKANELMAHAYASLFGVPATGLRFFTVYGPWGRPDMAMWLFTAAILDGTPLKLFNNGRLRRDFTYIDDVTEAVARLVNRPPEGDSAWSSEAPDPATSRARWRLYNVGNSRAIEVNDLVQLLERALGRTAVREFLPMEPGDVFETCADSADLEHAVGFRPNTPIEDGVKLFAEWFRSYTRS